MNSAQALKNYRPTLPLVSAVMVGRLAGVAEVAEICGVSKRTAATYVQRRDFPKPLDHIAAGPVWSHTAVERWAVKTLPLPPGRPPKARRRTR